MAPPNVPVHSRQRRDPWPPCRHRTRERVAIRRPAVVRTASDWCSRDYALGARPFPAESRRCLPNGAGTARPRESAALTAGTGKSGLEGDLLLFIGRAFELCTNRSDSSNVAPTTHETDSSSGQLK